MEASARHSAHSCGQATYRADCRILVRALLVEPLLAPQGVVRQTVRIYSRLPRSLDCTAGRRILLGRSDEVSHWASARRGRAALRRLGHSGATGLFGWAGWRRLSRSSCRVCISSCRFCRSSGRLRLLLRLWRTRLLLLQPSRQWSRACRRRRSWGGGAANLPVLCDHRTIVPHDQPRLQSHGTTHAAAAPLHPRRGERRSRAPVLSWERALPTKAATPSASRLEHVLVAAPACVVDVKSNELRAWT